MRYRRPILGASVLLSASVLCGCSASPEPEPTARHITAAEFEGLVLESDLQLGDALDLTFGIESLVLKAPSIQSFWEESSGSPEACLDSYFASALVSPAEVGAHSDDEFADVAGYYPGDAGAVNVTARSFESEDAAAAFIDGIDDGAAACNAAGGYELYQSEGVVGWAVTAVSIAPADRLGLPASVTALDQEESVAPGYAVGYRVTMLQFDNAVVAVTAQLHTSSTFTFDEVDELTTVVGKRLSSLR